MILGGIKRIARVASVMVPFMVGLYFIMVLYIILSNLGDVPAVFQRIFAEAFNLRAGFGALAGIAIIGARRAALVNDAGIGTASIMHGASRNETPVREGLIAMLGPSIDSGLVCTLTSMFSYSFYGTTCANYLFGSRRGRYYAWFFLASLIVFAIVPIETAVGACDLFYALMAIPTMIAVISLSHKVRRATREYFSRPAKKE